MSALRRLARRRAALDFSDYLELREQRDAGTAAPDALELLAHLERELPVPFASAIPHLVTLDDAPDAPPRGLTREELRVVFAMRREFSGHGQVRARLMGFPLPDGEALKDWLDFMETERSGARKARELLRELDRKVWAVMTGERRLPEVPLERLAPLAASRPRKEPL